MAKFNYVEPADYFPKEIREEIFGIKDTPTKKKTTAKKPAAKKTTVKKTTPKKKTTK